MTARHLPWPRAAVSLAVASLVAVAACEPPSSPSEPPPPPVKPTPAVLSPAPYRPVLFYSHDHAQSEHYGSAIFGMNPDGSGRVQISSPNGGGDRDAAYSPDGTKIVFVRQDSASRDHLAIMNADGTGLRLLTNSPDHDDIMPTWTPDGRIVFARSRVFVSPEHPEYYSQLYVVGADGSGLRPLVASRAVRGMRPSVNATGNQVTYQSSGSGASQIRAMSMDGSNDRLLAQNNGGGYLRAPVWTPDGARVLFSAEQGEGSNADLYTIRADGTELQQVTSTPTLDEQTPAYSRDGAYIYYQANAAGRAGSEIHRITVATGAVTHLTDDRESIGGPNVGPERLTLEITPDGDSLLLGHTLQLTATRRNGQGDVVAGGTTSWRALNSYYATVSSTGLVTAVSEGLALIEASNAGAYDTARVRVRAPVTYSYAVAITVPGTGSLAIGETVQLGATVTSTPAGGPATGTTTWQSLDAGIATVNASGLVSAVAAGTARIVATNGTAKDTATVTVVAPTPTTSLNLSAGAKVTLVRLANGTVRTDSGFMFMGDHEVNGDSTMQAFVAYDISGVPDGAEIETATVSVLLTESSIEGAPFSLGPLMVHGVTMATLNGIPDPGVQVAAAFAGFTSVDITEIVRSFRAVGLDTLILQFRFRDLVNGNGQVDYIGGNVGGLSISYRP